MNPGHRSRKLATLALASLALPLVQSMGRQEQRAGGADPVLGALPEAPAETSVEYFVLEEPIEPGAQLDLDGGASDGLRQVGLACWRRLQVPGGSQLEWDVAFPDQSTRVLHTERWTDAGPRLVWRELRPGSGRSLSAERLEPGCGLHVREWSGRFRLALELEAPGPFVLPLQLLELVRSGSFPPGGAWVFDPLARRFERVVPSGTEPGVRSDRRRVDLERDDGTSAGSWLFEGELLLAFRWQDGGLRARRIPAEEYERRLRPEAADAEEAPANVRAASGM